MDITHEVFANAIDHASWWLTRKVGAEFTFETVAYAGPKDLLQMPTVESAYMYSQVPMELASEISNIRSPESYPAHHELQDLLPRVVFYSKCLISPWADIQCSSLFGT